MFDCFIDFLESLDYLTGIIYFELSLLQIPCDIAQDVKIHCLVFTSLEILYESVQKPEVSHLRQHLVYKSQSRETVIEGAKRQEPYDWSFNLRTISTTDGRIIFYSVSGFGHQLYSGFIHTHLV